LKNYLGIDNGVTGSIGIILDNEYNFFKTPIKKELSYTKSKQWLNRIDFNKLQKDLSIYNIHLAVIERAMVNPGRFKATMSAMRALEATQIVLEQLKIPYQWIDSKEWQKAMLPAGLEKEELKEASLQIGKRLFPNIKWEDFDDADGILIARYAQLKNL